MDPLRIPEGADELTDVVDAMEFSGGGAWTLNGHDGQFGRPGEGIRTNSRPNATTQDRTQRRGLGCRVRCVSLIGITVCPSSPQSPAPSQTRFIDACVPVTETQHGSSGPRAVLPMMRP